MSRHPQLLIFGYGNPGRGDDGLGPAIAERIELLERPGIVVETPMQLNLEDAALVAEAKSVLFIDADVSLQAPFALREAAPAGRIEFTSHAMSPGALLAVCADYFAPPPPAWVLSVKGVEFGVGEGMSREAAENLEAALEFTLDWIEERSGGKAFDYARSGNG